MFGKPEWFKPKTIGWGLHPVTWQGWGYTAAWCGVLVVPFLVLLSWHPQPPVEALTWLAIGVSALVYDVRTILRAKQHPPASAAATATAKTPLSGKEGEVFYIGDSTPGPVQTRKFSLWNG